VGDSIPISDPANQKDTAAAEQQQIRCTQQDDMTAAVCPDRAAQGARRVTNTRGRKRQRRSTRWRWADPLSNSDTLDLAASLAAQGQGVWLALAATTAARDGARSIRLHAMKIGC